MKEINHEQGIESCLSRFDFDHVRSAMTTMNWTWAHAVNDIPSSYELIQEARRQFNVCSSGIDKDNTKAFCASGGFETTIEKFDDSDEYFYSLKFVIEEVEFPI